MNPESLTIHSKGIVRYPPGATFGPRLGGDYEFVWIVTGDCRIEVDGREYPAPPDSVFLCRPGQKIFFRWDPKKSTVHGFVHFALEDTFTDLGPPASWPIGLYLDQREDILRPLLRYAVGIENLSDHAAQSLARVNMLHALIVFVKQWQQFGGVALPGGNDTISRLFLAVHRLIDQDRPATISLPSLARMVKVSPEHLCRLTRQFLSITPMEVVYRVRIEKACTLLARTDVSIKQIAELLGFCDVYHFSRRFKKQTRVTPAQYRRLAYTGQVAPYSHIIPKK